ncbi:MAG: transporter permease subunit [Acidobacteriota bacterium]|nr:transporter permease subunit [Acidobacteriota bacterium]
MLLLSISLFLVQTHIDRYKNLIENNREFKEIETLKVNQFLNYTQYGLYGFRVFFSPAPLSIFFSYSGAFPGVTSFIDAGEKINFYNPVKGKTLFEQNPVGFMDFAGIIMLLGSLFALYTGYESLRHKEYLGFVATLSDYKKVFFSIAASRTFFTMIFFLLLTAGSVVLVNINGVAMTKNDWGYLLVYLAVMTLMLFFFFAVGMIGCSFKSKVNGVIIMISLWFALVFFIPWAIQAVMLRSSESIRPDCQMELEKLKLLMNFEKKALREVGVFKSGSGNEAPQAVKELAESYWQNEFKTIQAVEEKLKVELKTAIRRFETLSLLFPTTFYLSTNNAVSSKGYENFIDFYSYVEALKQEFLRFYLDRKFYTGQTGVESFVKGNENIYFSSSRLPKGFGLGMLMMLVYAVGGFTVAYFRFKRILFVPTGKGAKEEKDLDDLDVEMKKGQTYVLLTTGSAVNDRLYSFFSGRQRDFKGKVRLDDVNLVSGSVASDLDFTYLCPPGEVPGDMKVGDFLSFVKRLLHVSNKTMAEVYIRLGVEHIEDRPFRELPLEEKGKILLAAARLKTCSIYMFRDFLKGMAEDVMTSFTREFQDIKTQGAGAAILYLTDDVLLVSKIGDSGGSLRASGAPKLETYKLV